MKPTIVLPNRSGNGASENITSEDNLILVGANGAGKTRLGNWLEFAQPEAIVVHRISAQRALNIPDYTELKTHEQAERGLLFGSYDEKPSVHVKNNNRWRGEGSVAMLYDFDKVLSTLFAKAAKRDRDHSKEVGEKQAYIPRPNSPIELIEEIWQDIMPHRKIIFDDGKIMASKDAQAAYHGKGMSDGERVALYLIGQCLCAPENSIVIVDEPEIHLHKSLMSRVWNKIEELTPNKLIVYITHDLDFAASRKNAKKIWIKEHDGLSGWLWEEVPEVEGLPENLVIELIGNRKNIVFTEGEKGSYDSILYQAIYPEYHIVPRGNCEKVIEATKAWRESGALHHLQAYGIIDSDYRRQDEITALEKAGVYVVQVAEVENLFCLEPLMAVVASHLALNVAETIGQVKEFVFNAMKDELEVQITNHAEQEIQFRLNTYDKQEHSEKGLLEAYEALFKRVDVAGIYTDSKTKYHTALDAKDYESVLRIYNRKTLSRRISQFFKLQPGEYVQLLLRLIKSDRKGEIIEALQTTAPKLQ